MNNAEYSQQALVQLRRAVDQHFEQAQLRQPQALSCQAGCTMCCKPGLSVFGLEAHKIRGAFQSLRQNAPKLHAQVQAQGRASLADPQSQTHCPFLVQDRCTVYEERPLICRSHGLATKEDANSSVRNCELNYQDQPPDPQSIMRLDAVNLPLGVGAEMWHQATQTPLRLSLAEIAAQDDPPASTR